MFSFVDLASVTFALTTALAPSPVVLSPTVGDVVRIAKTTAKEGTTSASKSNTKSKKGAKSVTAKEAAAAKKAEEEAAAAKKAEEEAAAAKKAEEEAAAAKKAEEEAAAAKKAEEEAAAAKKAEEEAAAKNAAVAEARGLDARVRRLSDELALGIKRLPGDHRDSPFAVLRFQENDEETRTRKLGLVVSDLVITNLVRDHRVALVERGQLTAVLDELALQASGATDPAEGARLGKMAGARGVVVGDIVDAGDSFRVSARVLDVEAATVVIAAETSLPKDELIAYSADAVVLRSKGDAFFRSLVVPGWGQLYNREPGKAALFAGAVGTLVVAAATVAATGAMQHARYDGLKDKSLFPEEIRDDAEARGAYVEGLRESATMLYRTAGVVAGVALVPWLLGAIDAYFSGVDVDSLDAARARN